MPPYKKAHMGNIGTLLKRKYQRLVDKRAVIAECTPRDDTYLDYHRASVMNDRVFYLYSFESDYEEWNRRRRKMLGRLGYGRTKVGRKRTKIVGVKQFGVSNTEEYRSEDKQTY